MVRGKLKCVVLGWIFAVVLPACGSGDAPDEPPAVPPDEAIAGTISQILATGPSDSLIASFQREVARLQVELGDPGVVSEVIRVSLLSSIREPGQLIALGQISEELGGRVFSTRFVAPPRAVLQPGAASLCPANEPSRVIYYINGVGTPFTEALGNLGALQRGASSHLGANDDVEFRLFYNPSGSGVDVEFCILAGFLVRDARLSERERERWEQLGRESCNGRDLAHDLSREALAQWLFQTSDERSMDPLTTRFEEAISNDIRSGKKVTVVAHSQGNFYAREMVRNVLSTAEPGDSAPGRSLAVVSVGSPVAFDGGLVAQLGHHSVVQANYDLMTWIPRSPSGNVANPLSAVAREQLIDAVIEVLELAFDIFTRVLPTDRLAQLLELVIEGYGAFMAALDVHSFTASYLAYPSTAGAVYRSIQDSLAALRNDRPIAGQGYLQVSLSWDVDGDIDLYVAEPDGQRVYFGRPSGLVGRLDRDDTIETGPENYFVCAPEALAEGTYRVEVNNFAGATGTRATLDVRAGSLFRRFHITLGARNGGDILVPVATLEYRGGEFMISP